MQTGSTNMPNPLLGARGRRCRLFRVGALLGCAAVLGAESARAQERILFPAVDNALAAIVQGINNEKVRLDVGVWLLADGDVTNAILNKHKSGVPVRLIGDRASIFEGDPNTRAAFELLASNGVPIRLRYQPTSFPEIIHWKCGIFVGQHTVEFGSANWTTFELAPWSPTNYKDETAMFTNDASLVNAFLTQFDRMWADEASFLDWPQAYRRETGRDWNVPMSISRARLEPDYPINIPGVIWSQGSELVNALIAEIDREPRAVDFVIYRLTVPNLTDALIQRHRAGVPVRVLIEPTQYRAPSYPEYELMGAEVDRLWAAGIPIKQRLHEGLTHMKTLITSTIALNGSSNFTRFWQRDHNYFIPASGKPALYLAVKDRFNAMWNDASNYSTFQPQRPEAAALVSPGTGGVNIPTTTKLEWRRARWAVAFDVYLGTSPSNLFLAGRTYAQLDESPPATYAFTPPQPLAPSTTYYWLVVSRTVASDINPSLVAMSEIRSLTTVTGGNPPGGGPPGAVCRGSAPSAGWVCVNESWIPPGPVPFSDVSGCTTVQPAAGWLCSNGGWLPPDSPLAVPGGASAAPPSSAISCTTIQPVSGWICIDGGWVPPDSPLALLRGTSASAPASPGSSSNSSGCTTVQPMATWVCVNGGWVPPDSPLALSGGSSSSAPASPVSPSSSTGCPTPQPGAGWICLNGGWIPPGHPLSGGGGHP
jgi:hypothetical protein